MARGPPFFFYFTFLAHLYESTGRAIALPPASALGVDFGVCVNKNVKVLRQSF